MLVVRRAGIGAPRASAAQRYRKQTTRRKGAAQRIGSFGRLCRGRISRELSVDNCVNSRAIFLVVSRFHSVIAHPARTTPLRLAKTRCAARPNSITGYGLVQPYG
jgi:hypothetical protein